jgi:peptidoglycan hydrolase-like protein with peptidoglycan-binding domain
VVVVAGALVVGLLLRTVGGTDDEVTARPAPSTTAPSTTAPSTTTPSTTTPSTTTPSTTSPVTTAAPVTPTVSRAELRPGSRGSDVVALQERLVALGYQPGAIDGDFSTATTAAVIAFQTAKRLPADGVVGPSTWAALNAAQ